MTLRTVSSDRLVDGAKLEAIVTGGDGSLFLANDGSYKPGTNAVTSVSGRTGAVVLTKSDVDLSNVNNTSDLSKPVSSATSTVLALKADIASPTFTGTVTLPAGQVVNGVTLKNAGTTTHFLREDGVYAVPAGGGGGGGGTVTNVTSANADIAVANGTTTPTLTLNTGVTANKIVQLDGTARLPAVDGSQLTNLPVPVGVVPYTGATFNVNLGTNDILANNVWIEQSFLYTPAEVLNSFSTPLTILSAPGAGKAIIVQSVMLSMVYNTTPYTTNTLMRFAYGFGGVSIATLGGFLGNVADSVAFNNNLLFTASVNTGVQLYTDTGNPIGGNSTIKGKIWYKIITL